METEASGSSVSMGEVSSLIKRRDLFLQLQRNGLFASKPSQCTTFLFDYVADKLSKNWQQTLKKEELQRVLKSTVTAIFIRYRQCHRNSRILVKKHKTWLDKPLSIPMKSYPEENIAESASNRRGRPKKIFGESSKRTQNRQVGTLVSEKDPEQLLVATQKSLRLQGKRMASNVIEIASLATPKRLKRMPENAQTPSSTNLYSTDQALALMIDTRLTKDGYIEIQQSAKKLGHDIYPSYEEIQASKLNCYLNNLKKK